MNSTALRAEAQSAKNTHMVFANEEHEKFYYVKLQYYRLPSGFEDVITFTDSRSMFENLWQEWFDT